MHSPSALSVPPEQVAQARQMYLDGATVAEIRRATGMTNRQLYFWFRGGPPDGERHLPPLPQRIAHKGRSHRRKLTGDRVALVARLWRTAEAQVCDIEDRLARHRQQPDDRERDARTLAVLVKTMRELAALDGSRDGGASPADSEHDDGGPRDLEEFRRELARRMEAIIAARTEAVPGQA
jgi:transposase-like protein